MIELRYRQKKMILDRENKSKTKVIIYKFPFIKLLFQRDLNVLCNAYIQKHIEIEGDMPYLFQYFLKPEKAAFQKIARFLLP